MPANDYVRARIDPAIKQEAAAVLATMGLTVSDLCRMYRGWSIKTKINEAINYF